MPEGIHLGRILAGDKHPGVVYFLAMTYKGRPAVKIGTSERLLSRISSVSYAATLTDVLLLVPGGEDVEIVLHREFSAYQIDGFQELFWLKGRLKAFLDWSPPRNWFPLEVLRWGRLRRGSSFTPEPVPVPEPVPELVPQPEIEPEPVEVVSIAPAEAVTGDQPDVPGDPEPLKLSVIASQIPGVTLDALRKYSIRYPDFPGRVDVDGPAFLYNPVDVIAYVQNRQREQRERQAS